jgi:hypothetical protein
MSRFTLITGALALGIAGSPASAAPIAYTDEATYLADLAAFGYTAVLEGFQNDAVWGGVRSSIVDGFHTASSITSQGVTWTRNFNTTNSGVTTSDNGDGDWFFYEYVHGGYLHPGDNTFQTNPQPDCTIPELCGDGFVGTAASGVLYAVGGWIETNTPIAKIGLFLDGYPNNAVDFGETCVGEDCQNNSTLGTTPQFFGVIDTAGFTSFEYRELEGTQDEAKFIFADNFTFAGSALPTVPLPPALWLLGSGLLALTGIARRKR